MKYLGLSLLSVGIAIAASSGARMTPALEEQVGLAGAAQFRAADVERTFGAYCEARTAAGLEPADGCPDEGVPGPTEESLTGGVLPAREAWIAAAEASVEPAAAAAAAHTPGPDERLSAWWSQSGTMFLLGLALIVVGALIGRAAVKREATAEPAAGKDAPAKDFGAVLGELSETLRRLADDAKAVGEPKREDLERIKGEIEKVQLDGFEPLVAARQRVQVKYGMAGFAEIFGPLSASERRVNRSWSAVVDQHWPETLSSLEIAATELEEAKRVLEGLKEGRT